MARAMADRPDRFNRLPQWAQKEIERLERAVADLREDLAHVLSARDPSRRSPVLARNLDPRDPEGELPLLDAPIRYPLFDIEITVEGREGQERLSIRSRNRALHIEPSASNAIYVNSANWGEGMSPSDG